MANQGKNTSGLNVVVAPYNKQDRLVILYGASTANTANSIAQTATITIDNLFQNTSIINVTSGDPVNSTALAVEQGTIWATNSYIYVATSNNHVLRAALSSF